MKNTTEKYTVKNQVIVKDEYRLMEEIQPDGSKTYSVIIFDRVEIFADSKEAAYSLFRELAYSGMYHVDYCY